MCHHPEVQKKAAAEIDDFVARNGHLPTFKERNEVPYCISVTKECMRYRPTGPFSLPHATTEDSKWINSTTNTYGYFFLLLIRCILVEVDGYFIPKGSTVIACNYGMHRLPEVYPKPEQFTPERFMNNIRTMQSAANGKPEDRDHYNFGWGR
jgi:cytochrome P450